MVDEGSGAETSDAEPSSAPVTLASEAVERRSRPLGPALIDEPALVTLESGSAEPQHAGEDVAVAETQRGSDLELPILAISRLSPSFGAMSGGTRVSIEGTGFVAGSEVQIGQVVAPAELESASRLVCTTLARNVPGQVDVKVVNPDGTWTVALFGFEYCEAPRLTRITPHHALETGGTRASLTGSAFRPGAEVRIGAAHPRVDFVSATRVDLDIPAHPGGSYDVELTNPDGQSARLESAFRFESPPPVTAATEPGPVAVVEPPRVDALEPSRAPLGEHVRVAILGSGFSTDAEVRLGADLRSARFVSSRRLEVELPASALAALVDLELRNPDGQAFFRRGAFEFCGPPRIDSVDPREGSAAGELVATIVGDGFDRACGVSFGGSSARCEWQSATRLRVTVPATLEARSVDVVVTNSDGQSAELAGAFRYTARVTPVVDRIQPSSGPTSGNTPVLVVGEHLDRVTAVFVDDVPAPSFKTRGSRELAFLTPARSAAAVVDVELRARDGARVVRKKAFSYHALPPPVIRSVTPNRGAVKGGTAITVSGEHFAPGSSVLVDGKPAAAVQIRSETTIELQTPPGESGRMVDVAVRSASGQAVAPRAFLYDPRQG